MGTSNLIRSCVNEAKRLGATAERLTHRTSHVILRLRYNGQERRVSVSSSPKDAHTAALRAKKDIRTAIEEMT